MRPVQPVPLCGCLDPTMRSTLYVSFILIAALGSHTAFASSAGLGVTVQVVPAHVDPALVEALPMPDFSRPMAVVGDARRQAVSILHADLGASTGHFEASMPALGFRLASLQQRGTQAIQVWTRGGEHVRLEFELAVAGDQPLVRMSSSGYRSPPVLAAR